MIRSVMKLVIEAISEPQWFPLKSEHDALPKILYLKLFQLVTVSCTCQYTHLHKGNQ